MLKNQFAPGKHLLIDFYNARHLTDIVAIETVLKDAADVCKATVLKIELHSFGKESGVTGVALLAESHISIHTWPEARFAAIDIFMCGNSYPELAIEPLKKFFNPQDVKLSVTRRGTQSQFMHPDKIAS
jgi:S-adenosylmethionine decarboxylase